jgi:DNA helicase-4
MTSSAGMADMVARLKRRPLPGALLRSLGHASWAAERTASGINFLGGARDEVPFSVWAGPATLTSTLGFATLAVPLVDGTTARLAGVRACDAASFISAANDAFRRHILRQFTAAESELTALADVISRLDQPRRYPAACLLAPFLERAATIITALPPAIPGGILSEDQHRLIETVRAFHDHPEQARRAAIERFIASDLTAMSAFFDRIEKNPLTPEQRLAVVTDEDATLVLAGAGSGKTSVIVAKAAYLIERGIRPPDEILLLAFGRDAAAEMAAGIEEHLHLALLVANDDDLVLSDIVDEVVARIGDMAFVTHEVPRAGIDILHLQIVEALVGEDAPVQRSLGRVEIGTDFSLARDVPRLLHQVHRFLLLSALPVLAGGSS